MFNPQQMGMGNLPKMPTVKELWKNEKVKYRHWIIMFGIAIITLASLSSIAFVFLALNIDTAAQKIMDYWIEHHFVGDGFTFADARREYIWQTLIFSGFQVIGLIVGVFLFVSTTIKAYHKHNFAFLSQWASFMVGLAAFIGAYQLLSMLWSGGRVNYNINTSSGIFSMVFNATALVVWVFVSIPLGRIRREFAVAYRIEQIKNSPQYKAMMGQAHANTNNSDFANFSQGPFGPNVGQANGYVRPDVNSQSPGSVNPAEPIISPKEKRLRDMSLEQLNKVANELSISGTSTMNKNEIIKAILRVTNED